MRVTDFLDEIKRDIARGIDLRQIFRRIEFLLKGHPQQLEIIHHSGRYETLQREIRLGTLDYQTQSIERNKISSALLSFIEVVEDEVKENEKFKRNIEREINTYNEREASCPGFWEWLKGNRKVKILVIFFAILYATSLLVFLKYSHVFVDPLGKKTWNLPVIVHWLFIVSVSFWLFKFRRFSISEIGNVNEGNEPNDVTIENKIRDRLRLTKLASYEDWSEVEKNKLWASYKKGVNDTLEQFSTGWFFMWALWAIFYSVILCGVKEEWVKDFLNYLGTATFLFMYLTLTITTTGRIIFSLLIKILLIISLITALQFYITPRFQSNEQDLQAMFWFRLVVGIIACSVFSTVFGRLLDSKFVNTPILISVGLYAYAAIQPLYAFWDFTEMGLVKKQNIGGTFKETGRALVDIEPTLMFFSLTIAFYLKLLLFLVISWILRSGRLLFFVAQEGSLNYKQDDEIKEFMKSVPIENSRII